MSGLRTRVLAAVVLIPLVVAAVLWLPTAGFAVVVAGFALAGAWEWTRVGDLPGAALRAGFIAAVALSLALAYAVHGRIAPPLLTLALLFWGLALAWVAAWQAGRQAVGLDRVAVRFIAGWLVLVPTWVALVWLHARWPALVMYVLVLIWVADSAAFFAGRRFGRRKLADRVSPGKSWEGVAGGVLAVAVLAAGTSIARGAHGTAVAGFVALSLLVAFASVLGDLAESLFKRRAGVKDSGTLIPGHGGVLDRIDSLTAAAPLFAAGWMLLGEMR